MLKEGSLQRENIKPLLKWAGGKRQLNEALYKRIPEHFGKYFEPFLGGASFLVNLYNHGRINNAIVSDLNTELINFYRVIKDCPDVFINAMNKIQLNNDAGTYYSNRAQFNEILGNIEFSLQRSILFLYLNKHCYNGLWRVNSSGKFNVPYGRYKTVNMLDKENLYGFSSMLQNIEIENLDFESCVKGAHKNDFVYFDPPYQPLNKTSSFTGYTYQGFNFNEQLRLFKVFQSLTASSVKVMLSNSYSEEIKELYNDFNIEVVDAKRYINSVGTGRTGAKELIITNY
ncbi:MAG: DNA adenine methylase [Ferroplasma sp.]|uniref:DNA adenine methylase n=1 Tax=Ferroplasma sp. TaxID=2591003 RepID=UPI00281647BE|nr:DNA adenine methylase [Ferroplasma sp.]WMT50567.1 MAG: DNA adenine methylase [Ferroplasma sp.]